MIQDAKRTIFKYDLVEEQTEILAGIEKILSVQIQQGELKVWVLINDEIPKKLHSFKIYGTGWPIDGNPGDYVGTVQQGPYVWHIFHNLQN